MHFFSAYSLVFLTTSIIAHWVMYRWALASFPPALRHRRGLAIATVVLVAMQPITRAMMQLHQSIPEAFYVATLLEFLTVAIASLPIGLVRLATGTRPRAGPGVLPCVPEERAAAMTRRQTLEGAVGVGFLGATGSLIGWGAVRGRHAFEIEEVVVRIAGLPRALDGYTIAHVSDIHTGLCMDDRDLALGMSRVAEIRPDMLVATGDLVDFDADYARLVARKLSDVGARDGTFAILGNHDYYAGADAVVDALRKGGVDMLVNDGRRVRPGDGGGFALLGVDDFWAARFGSAGPDLARAIAMVPPDAPRILLSHQPKTVDLWKGQVALQLSGHTHGGQINPGFRPAALFMKYLAGRYEVAGTTLYVNRGFGTAGPPSRVGAPPEVTKVILVSA